MNWPDTREQSMLDTDDFSLAAWVVRAFHVLKPTRNWMLRRLYRGPFRFSVYVDWDVERARGVPSGQVWIDVRVRGWWIFSRWENVFHPDDLSHWPKPPLPDTVKTAVRDAVWALIREAELAERVLCSARWGRLHEAVKK